MRELPEAEYRKIRNHILGIIYHAGHESVMVPSSRELASQFGVARATATKALDLLVKEGYLLPKKGVGMFSNPQKTSFHGSPFKVVGMLISAGKNFFHDYSGWVFPALTGLELTRHDLFVREIHLTGIESPERMAAEIRGEQIDALLCVAPPPELLPVLHALTREGFPIISMFEEAGARSCLIDRQEAGYQFGKLLRQEKRNRVAGLFTRGNAAIARGIRRAYEETGTPLTLHEFGSIGEFRDFLADGGRPEAFYITGAFDSLIIDILEEFGIDYRRDCRLATYRSKVIDPRFCGYQHVPPEQEMSQRAADDMLKLLMDKEIQPGPVHFQLELRAVNLK